MEAEAVEEDAAKLVLRRRDLSDVALEFLNRGDIVGASGLNVSYTGVVTHAAGDLTIIDTPHSVINVNLEGPISLHVTKRAQSGGRSRANGSQSYRSRMLELEISGEFVEIVSSGSGSTEGTISVVGSDHVVLIYRQEFEKNRQRKEETDTAQVLFEKVRNGSLGAECLQFEKGSGFYESNAAPDHDESEAGYRVEAFDTWNERKDTFELRQV